MLHIEQLSFAYTQPNVIHNLSLTAYGGDVHGIVGVNGAGKTTLIKLIAGTLKATQGIIAWNATPLSHQYLAYLESEVSFYSRITGKEYLSLFAKKNPLFNIDSWNDIFQLPLTTLIDNYSSGMRKKLALMSIVALDKPLIILDEPFNALDIDGVEILKSLIYQWQKQDKIIILTSHIVDTLINTCDYIHTLKQGTIAQSYSKDNFENFAHDFLAEKQEKLNHQISNLLNIK